MCNAIFSVVFIQLRTIHVELYSVILLFPSTWHMRTNLKSFTGPAIILIDFCGCLVVHELRQHLSQIATNEILALTQNTVAKCKTVFNISNMPILNDEVNEK